MANILLKSVVHNVGVLIVGFAFAYLGTAIDTHFHLAPLAVPFSRPVALALLTIGFSLRLWAAYQFYLHHMYIISFEPQSTLITTGPYRFSRNPLYLGGNVFVFFGASLWLRSPAAVAMTVLHLPLIDLFIRGEERQLEQKFGDQWRAYKKRVRRWL